MAPERQEVFAARVREAIAAWGEDVANLVESDEGFSLAVQAKWFRLIDDAMQQEALTGEDRVNEAEIEDHRATSKPTPIAGSGGFGDQVA